MELSPGQRHRANPQLMAHRKRMMLLDADVLRYLLAFSNTEKVQWDEEDDPQEVMRPDLAKRRVHEYIESMMETIKASDYRLVLSESSLTFRHDFYPDYKSNRAGKPKPRLWFILDGFMKSEFGHKIIQEAPLEGDDILGIMASNPALRDSAYYPVIVSIDKDMQTVPGWLYNPNRPEEGIRLINEHDANYFWMTQVLTGDPTDGYPGCPKVGKVKASAALHDLKDVGHVLTPAEHLEALWERVVSVYASKGLPESTALTQARCARILRHGDLNPATREITLWQPPTCS